MTAGLIIWSIVSAAATLATLTTSVAVLHGRQLHTLPRAAKAMLVLTFLGISIASGVALFETTQRTHAEPAIHQRPASSLANKPSPFTADSGVVTTSNPTVVKPQPRPRNANAMTRRDEIIVDQQDGALSDVVGAADDTLKTLRSRLYTVRGHLRSAQSQPDERLQGLITTDFTLDVTLVDRQGVVHGFTITSRGGGFTSGSSALQARERLGNALHEHLQREHP